MPRQTASLLGLLALCALGRAQSTLTPTDALHQAFAQRDVMTTNRQKLEEARRTAIAAGAYPATRLDLGRDLFNKADIMGSADLLLYQPLDIFGKSRVAGRQGRAGVATALATFRQGALDLQQELLTAYANLLSAQRLLDLAKGQRELAESVRVSTAKRVEARDLPEIQAARAQLEVDRADGLVTDRQAALEAARLRLSGAMGADAASNLTLGGIELPAGDPTVARPELLLLRADVAQANADAQSAKQGLLPDLEIQAGRTGFNTPTEYGARLQLTATLWDNGATRNRVQAAEARKKAATSALADKVKVAEKDIAAAKVELAAADRSVANYTKLAEGAKTLLDRTQRGFELGANSLIDVLDARRALSDAQELTVNAQLRRDLAVEAVLRAEGRFLEEPK